MRRGIADADGLATKLHLRDVRGDDRAACVECHNLAGRPGAWRCGDHVRASVGRDLPADLTTQLHRCNAFATVAACDLKEKDQ